MQYIQVKNQSESVKISADAIITQLKTGKKVLWLIPGGSNIPISVEAMKNIRHNAPSQLNNLTISLTDERYGEVGHKDSNWQQLIDTGFNFDGIETIPVLTGKTLDGTAAELVGKIESAMKSSDFIIGQFGMGADGHIAGILPHSPATTSKSLVCAYDAAPFTRITLTFEAIKRISSAYLFISGSSKDEAMESLINKEIPRHEQPVQVLKQLGPGYVFIYRIKSV